MRFTDLKGPRGLVGGETGHLVIGGAGLEIAEFLTGVVAQPKPAFYVEAAIGRESFIGLDQNGFPRALLAAAEAARCAGYELPVIGLHPLFEEDETTWFSGWGLVRCLPVNLMEATTDHFFLLGAAVLTTGVSVRL